MNSRRLMGSLPRITLYHIVVGNAALCITAGETANPIYSLVAQPEISSFAQLKGKDNRDTVVRFVRAIAAAYRFIRDPVNRAEVITAIVQLTGSSNDIARATLALYLEPDKGVLPKQAEIDIKGLAQVIAFMGEGGAIRPPLPAPERFVDAQYLRLAGVE